MKKSFKIMSALLLFSSVVFSTTTVTSIVHAEETAVTAVDASATLRDELQNLVNQGNAILATPELYTADSLASLSTSVDNAQNALTHNLEASYATYITSMNNALAGLVSIAPSTTETTTTDTDTTTDTTTTDTNTTDTTTDTTTTDTDTTGTTTDTTTTDTNTTDTTTDTTTTDTDTTTGTSLPPEVTPSITISDQTMYVGQTLTEDIILSWATFNNAEGYIVGFEVVGDPIQVTALGSTLVEPGNYAIRFYVSKPTRATGTVVAEKTITLNILPENEQPLNPIAPVTPTQDTKTGISPLLTPVSTLAPKTIGSGKTTAKQLPVTGESNNGMMIASAGVMLIAGAYIFRKKQVTK